MGLFWCGLNVHLRPSQFTILFRSLLVWVLYIIKYMVVDHFIVNPVFILVEYPCFIICLSHHCKINSRTL